MIATSRQQELDLLIHFTREKLAAIFNVEPQKVYVQAEAFVTREAFDQVPAEPCVDGLYHDRKFALGGYGANEFLLLYGPKETANGHS